MKTHQDLRDLRFSIDIVPETLIPTLSISFYASENFSSSLSANVLYWLKNGVQTWVPIGREKPSDPFSVVVPLSQYAASGEYEIRAISLLDNSSTTVYINSDQISKEFNQVVTTILDNPQADSAPPTLDYLTIDAPVTSETAIEIPIRLKASDNLSGINSDFIVELISPSGASIQRRFSFDTSGEFSGVFTLPRFSASGIYLINTVRIEDRAGNSNFSQDFLGATNSAIEIANLLEDVSAPILTNFRLSAEFDPQSGRPRIVFTGTANDSGSGIKGILARLESETSNWLDTWIYYDHGTQGNEALDFVNYKALTSDYSPGTYNIAFVTVADMAGNQESMGRDKLIEDGFAGSINVYYQQLSDQDTIKGGELNDFVFTISDSDSVLLGLGGNDSLFGRKGNDFLKGGDGDDQVDGGAGDDLINGGKGNDLLKGGSGSDTAHYHIRLPGFTLGAEGGVGITANLLTGKASGTEIGNDTLVAIENIETSDGNDTITGSNSANQLISNGGDDIINANGGDDILIGGQGDDSLDGGEGDDQAVYSGVRDDYEVSQDSTGSKLIIKDRRKFYDGIDTITGIETVRFADNSYTLADLTSKSLDFNGDGNVDTFDSLLMMRHMMGTYPGESIKNDIPGNFDFTAIQRRLSNAFSDTFSLNGGLRLDIDGDKFISAFNDGMMITQHIQKQGKSDTPWMPPGFNPPPGFPDQMNQHLKDLIGF